MKQSTSRELLIAFNLLYAGSLLILTILVPISAVMGIMAANQAPCGRVRFHPEILIQSFEVMAIKLQEDVRQMSIRRAQLRST